MSAVPETIPQPMETEAGPVAGDAPHQGAEKDKENGMPASTNEGNIIESEMKASKVVFRLDDGTTAKFICDTKTVELLDPQAAWKAGALKEEHLLRIQSLLCEVHAKLPEEGPLKSVSLLSSKRSIDTVLEVGQINSAKKAKSMFGNHVSSKFNFLFGGWCCVSSVPYLVAINSFCRHLLLSCLPYCSSNKFSKRCFLAPERLFQCCS